MDKAASMTAAWQPAKESTDVGGEDGPGGWEKSSTGVS